MPALLSRVLLSFALECERESELSLAISANVLRVYHQVLAAIEQRWHKRFTGRTISALRASLEVLVTAPDSERPPSFPGRPPSFHGLPPIFAGLEPYPDNWRASVRPPGALPWYPMVLHRGGYPDGS